MNPLTEISKHLLTLQSEGYDAVLVLSPNQRHKTKSQQSDLTTILAQSEPDRIIRILENALLGLQQRIELLPEKTAVAPKAATPNKQSTVGLESTVTVSEETPIDSPKNKIDDSN